MCEDLVLLCNLVNQSYDIPMDVSLVDEHYWVYQILCYILFKSHTYL
jgi:hypothetical protein